ncbi:MAG: heme ABC exporter ATP-binding protein CcmA [Devosia sp.]|nr:heme ABC exporter ATP-binding protein CcmA [Devosia sp.]
MSASPTFAQARLRVRGLTVRRGERLLFADLAFELAPGEVLLLRGSNGTGKSTLLLTLAGVVRAEGGSVEITGPDELPQMHLLNYQHGIKARLTAAENLGFWRRMYGETGVSVAEALQAVGIGGLAGLEAGYLSSGQVRRLSLARLLVSYRPLWLLDEPSAALDRDGEALLGRLIDAHREAGGMAVIATHHALPLANGGGITTLVLGDSP